MMTDREVFEKVKAHLLSQNKKSIIMYGFNTNGICAYRGDNNLQCAVGCLIKDEFYTSKLEGMMMGRSTTLELVLNSSGVPDSSFQMLRNLQSIHDCQPPELWQEILNKIENVFFGSATYKNMWDQK